LTAAEERGLLDAIRAERGDDTPRLSYADWLAEHAAQDMDGDPLHDKAQFIRHQVHAARLSEGDEKRSELESRATELLKRHREEWEKPFRDGLRLQQDAIRCEYEGGVVTGVKMRAADFIARGEELFRLPAFGKAYSP
jgi:uncharacterized protein (TIGR02996 family)